MGGNAHDGAFAVTHQHVIADPDFDFLTGQGMRDKNARRHALLLHGGEVGFHHRTALALLDERSERRMVARGAGRERMLGGNGNKGDAHDGVGAGGEDPEQAFVRGAGTLTLSPSPGGRGKLRAAARRSRNLVWKREAHAVALADPVGLHRLHALGPAGESVEHRQQLVGVAGDRQVIHRDLALFHRRAGAPAAAVDHLFVGENGLIDRVPVDHPGLLVGETLLQHAQEQPLVPAIVLGAAGRKLAAPVDAEAERLQLRLHVSDVVVGPFRRRHRVRHRRVLGRQSERIPSHGLQHLETPHAMVAGEHVPYGIVSHVTHVQLAGGVGKHRQAVILGFAHCFHGAERACLVPIVLGVALDSVRVVSLLHDGTVKKVTIIAASTCAPGAV